MPNSRIPPKRGDFLVEKTRVPTLRTAKFLEALPDQMSAITDVALSAPSANEVLLRDKINEILAELNAAKMMGEL